MLLQVEFNGNSSMSYTYHCPDDTDVREGDTVVVPGRYSGARSATVVSVGGPSAYVRDILSVKPRPKFRVRIVSSDTGALIETDWDTLEQAEDYLRQWLRQGHYSEASIICE